MHTWVLSFDLPKFVGSFCIRHDPFFIYMYLYTSIQIIIEIKWVFFQMKMKHDYRKEKNHWPHARKNSNFGKYSWKDGSCEMVLYIKVIDACTCQEYINLQNNLYVNASKYRIKLSICNIYSAGWKRIYLLLHNRLKMYATAAQIFVRAILSLIWYFFKKLLAIMAH